MGGTLAGVSEDDYADMVEYLRPSLVAESIERLRPHFPSFRRQMCQRGFDRVPPPLCSAGPKDDLAADLFLLLIKQAMDPKTRDASDEHNLRNITRIRPGGRWKP